MPENAIPSVDPKLGMVSAADPGGVEASRKRIAEKFALSTEARESLRAAKVQLIQQPGCGDGLVADPAVWAKVSQRDRLNTYGCIFAAMGAHQSIADLRREMAVPSIKASITADPTLLVTVMDSVVRELAVPAMFAREFLGTFTHPAGSGGTTGNLPVADSDSYLFQPKDPEKGYQKVVSNKVVAPYTIEDRGIEVIIDRFGASLFAWDEVARQMRLIANGGARSVNMVIYDRLLGTTGAYQSPVTALQNVGGTALSTILQIDGTNATRYSTTGSANTVIYQDILYASKRIQERPNPSMLQRMGMRAHQWLQLQQMAVTSKIAFGRVVGRGIDLVPSPNFDGTLWPVMIIIDDDIPRISSLNCIIYAGAPEQVGDYVEYEPTTIARILDQRTNEDILPARQANTAVWWGYSNIVVETGLAIA
jgi:hypothetical protein